jgi:phosphoglycolate phosphatase
MKMRLPAYLFFDLDGTILDSLPGVEYSVKAAFDSCGIPLRKASLRQLIGPPIRTILSRAGEITEIDVLDQLEGAFRTSYDTEGWRKTVCFPDAHAVLRTIQEHGHRHFVVSNKPRHIALRILENEGMLDLFEEILTSDSRSPAFEGKAEMIGLLMARYGIGGDNCLFVGDTMEDAQAAAAAGIGFVYMSHGYGEIVETPDLPVTRRFERFSQFLPFLIEEPVCD